MQKAMERGTRKRLIESAILRKSSHGNQDDDGDVVEPDDVARCYAEANLAPGACNESLSTVLKSLIDASSQFIASGRG